MQIVLIDAANHERAAIEFRPGGFKRFFGGVELRGFETIAQRDERVVGVVIDEINRAAAVHASYSLHFAIHFFHRRIERFDINHAHNLHVTQFAKRPGGVVVDVALRIVRRPVLIIEHHVGDAAVGLIHSHDVTARRERARGCLFFLLTAVAVAIARSPGLCGSRARGFLLRRQSDGERRGRAVNFAALHLQQPQQFGLSARTRIVARENISRRPCRLRLQDRILALRIKIPQEVFAVGRKMRERNEQPRLLIIVVVALRPSGFRQRRILFVPRARIFRWRKRALDRVGAAVAEGFVKAADAVVRRGDEHQITRRPGVERAVSEDAGHSEFVHLADVVPADQMPFVGQYRINPRVVGLIADRVVVKVRHRFVQVVQHLRPPIRECVEHVSRQLQRHRHRIAVVVVRDIMAPVNQPRPVLVRIGQMPFVNVHLPVASVNFDNRCDQRDQVVSNLFDVRAFINRQTIGQFHQRRRRTCFGRMNRAGDVIDRNRVGDDLFGFVIVQIDHARVGQLSQLRAILFDLCDVGFGTDRDGDHLAALFGLAD
ncbi:MAG: hypothetical protein JMDDDDMK_02089 [Acidobacteria bacterium]|nr:hypothetical protein [Acidobacteriota bacterium]